MEALANGFAEAIALGPSGMVSEGSGQNVFLVDQGELVTTPLDGTLLGGITRASIIALASAKGITVREQPFRARCSTRPTKCSSPERPSELTPVRSVDHIKVGAGKPGPVTKHLQKAFLDIANGRAEDTFGWLTHVR